MNFFETVRKLRESKHNLEDNAMASKASQRTEDAHAFSAMGDHGNGALHHGAAADAHAAAAAAATNAKVKKYHGLMAAHHNTMKSYHEAQ